MIIKNMSSISQLYAATKTRSSRANNADDNVQKKDEFVLSSEGQSFSELLGKLRNTSDVRQDRVDELSAKIQNGSYNISSMDIAAKILASGF